MAWHSGDAAGGGAGETVAEERTGEAGAAAATGMVTGGGGGAEWGGHPPSERGREDSGGRAPGPGRRLCSPAQAAGTARDRNAVWKNETEQWKGRQRSQCCFLSSQVTGDWLSCVRFCVFDGSFSVECEFLMKEKSYNFKIKGY